MSDNEEYYQLPISLSNELSKEEKSKNKIDELFIQNEIDKLNVDALIRPEQNKALKKVIKTDRKIVMNLDEQVSKLQKCCQYGAKVSKIINYKAEGLSTVSLKEKLKLILETFYESFSSPKAGNIDNDNSGNGDNSGNNDDNNGNEDVLDFKKISKYFSTKTFSFCSLNYDTIPLNLFINNENTFNLETKEKKTYSREKNYAVNFRKLKEYEYDKEPEIRLETYEQAMNIKDRLKEIEKSKKNINFVNFIIDSNPINGYNETTFRLFLITLLVSKGYVEFYKDKNNILCIKSSYIFEYNDNEQVLYDQNNQIKKKNQAVLTPWSYDKWEKIVNQLKSDHK